MATVGDVTLPVTFVDPKVAPGEVFTYVDIGSIDNRSNRIVDPKSLRGRDAPSRARQLLQTGDTVFSTVRTYLRNIAFVDASLSGSIGSTGFSVLRPADGVNPRLLHYYARTNAFVDGLSAQMRGTSYPAVVDSQVRAMAIPVPPSAEQERIVGAIEDQFSRLDAGAAALERVGRNIKRLRAAVLEAAVTGLLLNDARVTEKWGASAFGAPTGELPAHWRWAELGDLIVEGPQNGLYLPASQYGRGTAILRIADFQDGWAQRRDALQLVAASAADVITFELEVGDIVINRVNSMTHLGKCLVVTPSLAGAVFESNMMRLRTSDELTGKYLALYLQSNRGRSQLLKNAKQAVNQASINQNDVRRCRIAVPPLHEQKAIISIHETVSADLSSVAAVVRLTGDRASSLRSTILAAAFSGELVLQDPKDEPASVLLERVVSERASSNGHKTAGGRKSGTRLTKVLA